MKGWLAWSSGEQKAVTPESTALVSADGDWLVGGLSRWW